MLAVPESNVLDIPTNRVSKWHHIQKMHQHFWQRLSAEYLYQLQQRPKWILPTADFEKGALVLLIDNRYPPTKCQMGRIKEVFPVMMA